MLSSDLFRWTMEHIHTNNKLLKKRFKFWILGIRTLIIHFVAADLKEISPVDSRMTCLLRRKPNKIQSKTIYYPIKERTLKKKQ